MFFIEAKLLSPFQIPKCRSGMISSSTEDICEVNAGYIDVCFAFKNCTVNSAGEKEK